MSEWRQWLCILAVASIAALAGAAPASAQWDTNGSAGGSAVSLVGPPIVITFVSGDVPPTTTSFTCQQNRADARLYGPTNPGSQFPAVIRFVPTIAFCTWQSFLTASVTCTEPFYTAADVVAGKVTGTINSFFCDMSIPNLGNCGVAPTLPINFVGNMYRATYNNATATLTAPATGNPPTSGQDLRSVYFDNCRLLMGTSGSAAVTITVDNGSVDAPYTLTAPTPLKPTIDKT
jgi:hypothetical protein